jgi:hypothetical protein
MLKRSRPLGLFLEMWDEIGEGEVITDNALTGKVRNGEGRDHELE